MERTMANEEAKALSDAHGWTRVADDTGGGNSLTNFELLYIQGDVLLAAAAIEALFNVAPTSGTEEYGEALSFKYSESFADASWFERGCGYDSSARKPIEGKQLEQWSRKYYSDRQWMKMCEASIGEAEKHFSDWRAIRDGKMFLCPRAEALSMALMSRVEGTDHDQKGAWAQDLLEELRRNPLPMESPNRLVVGDALANIFVVATRIAKEARLGYKERPEQWALAANMLRGEDFAMARLLAGDEQRWLYEIDRAQLRLLGFPEPSSTVSAEEVLAGAGVDVIERLLAMCRGADEFYGKPEMASTLEAAALALWTGGAELEAGKGGLRL